MTYMKSLFLGATQEMLLAILVAERVSRGGRCVVRLDIPFLLPIPGEREARIVLGPLGPSGPRIEARRAVPQIEAVELLVESLRGRAGQIIGVDGH